MARFEQEGLLTQLERHEGRRDQLYFDPLGILTGGVGHALGHVSVSAPTRAEMERAGVMDRRLSTATIEVWLSEDVAAAEKELRVLAGLRGVDFDSLSPPRQQALLNMAFNLGAPRLGEFRRMWEALAAGNWDRAATEALDSRWASQVGPRARELAGMIGGGD